MEITKEMIEEKLGYEINGFNLEPIYKGSECIGLSINVEPKRVVEYIENKIEISGSGDTKKFGRIDPDKKLFYMFDPYEPWTKNRHVMLSHTYMRFEEIRDLFYNYDLSDLTDFSVIVNVHSNAPLGTYIVHKDFVEVPFIRSDDFDVFFTIPEYIEARKFNSLTKSYDIYEELSKFKEEMINSKNSYLKSHYYWLIEEGKEFFNKKTIWTVSTFDDKPIALTSETDSERLRYYFDHEGNENYTKNFRYSKFRVKNIEEGLEYLKMNKK